MLLLMRLSFVEGRAKVGLSYEEGCLKLGMRNEEWGMGNEEYFFWGSGNLDILEELGRGAILEQQYRD